MGTASGKYRTDRDGGVQYEYDATWDLSGSTLVWSARVRPAGERATVIDGQVNLGQHSAAIDLAAAVRCLVETSIEYRLASADHSAES